MAAAEGFIAVETAVGEGRETVGYATILLVRSAVDVIAVRRSVCAVDDRVRGSQVRVVTSAETVVPRAAVLGAVCAASLLHGRRRRADTPPDSVRVRRVCSREDGGNARERRRSHTIAMIGAAIAMIE